MYPLFKAALNETQQRVSTMEVTSAKIGGVFP